MKFLKALALSLLVAKAAFALTEGVEYKVLPQPLAQPLVSGAADKTFVEVWAYRCTHCNKWHKGDVVGKIAAGNPDVKISYMLLPSAGDHGTLAAQVFAYAHAQDDKAGKPLQAADSLYHKLMDVYFTAYFKNKASLGTKEESDKFYSHGFAVLGIDKAKLDEFLASDEGKKYLEYGAQAEAYKAFGTPGPIVNGKYLLDISKFGSPQALVDAVKELSAK